MNMFSIFREQTWNSHAATDRTLPIFLPAQNFISCWRVSDKQCQIIIRRQECLATRMIPLELQEQGGWMRALAAGEAWAEKHPLWWCRQGSLKQKKGGWWWLMSCRRKHRPSEKKRSEALWAGVGTQTMQLPITNKVFLRSDQDSCEQRDVPLGIPRNLEKPSCSQNPQ